MRIIITCIFLFFANCKFADAQSASQLINEAEKLVEQKEFAKATELYTKALQLKPLNRTALEGRSKCYMQIFEYANAIDDYKFLVNAKPHNVEYIVGLGDAYKGASKIKSAIEYYKRALTEKNDNHDIYERLIIALIIAKEYDSAQNYSNEILSKSVESPVFFFLKGVSLDSMANYQTASLSYERAIKLIESDRKISKLKDKTHLKKYYYNLALDYQLLVRYDDAITNYLKALLLDKADINCYNNLGKIYYILGNYNEAIAKFNDALTYTSTSYEVYFNRGLTYKKQKQYFAATQDFNSVIKLNPKHENAYIEKAACMVELNQFETALEEYNKVATLNPENIEVPKLIKLCKTKQYEFSREREKPTIRIVSPAMSETESLIISVGFTHAEIKGVISDQSKIQKVLVNDVEAEFEKEKLNPNFFADVSVEGKTEIIVKATDIYNNTQIATYTLTRRENTPPNIELVEPLATANNEIYIGKNATELLKIEGVVNDESLIKQLIINDVAVSISTDLPNPTFTYNFNHSKNDTLTVEAIDIFGNYSKTKFVVNRKASVEAATNPMGITWVVFISNSNYVNFTSLDGPQKDKEKIKSALSGYRVDKFIDKTDMTKEEMEKFFAIELRNLLKSTQVNSLLIWFAGHGKYLNDNGYWIPVNANKGEEYSYFQITNLKGYISTYKLLKHILVVSDACETGPAFCSTEPSDFDHGDCGKSDAINQISSQVFTSSSTEQSSDVSIFADTFSRILTNNTNKCLGIDKIKNEVSSMVMQHQKQKPKFGNITGLIDNGGSFYFIKK